MSGYPSAWERFDRNMPSAQPSWFGFQANVGQMNQFAARFRLANSFIGMDLDGYGNETLAGYNSLFRTLLVWSMLEQYLMVTGVRQEDFQWFLDLHHLRREARRIIEVANRDYFRFIHSQVSFRHKKALTDCFSGRSDNLSFLASSIRHIFAHGVLTPNARGVEPSEVIRVCDAISDFLLRLVDADFERRVSEFESSINIELPNYDDLEDDQW